MPDFLKIFLIFSFMLASWAHAAIYEWQDDYGKKHYSDQATPEAKTLNINPGYSFFIVAKVYDGDTIELDNGEKIRLLGINTPEIQHWDKPADAGGDEAKQWLNNKLKNRKVRLVLDVEKTDKYDRTLAHVFTDSNEHINLALVAAGLAEASIYPPNLRFADELVAAQRQAEQKRLGIWQLLQYAPISDQQLTAQNHTGWKRVVAKVIEVRQTKKSIYLKFSDSFEARIEKDWAQLFPDINRYQGQRLEVRGWVNKNRGKYSMLIRHPSAIVTLP